MSETQTETVSLDEAWAEAEAALPEGWELHVWSSPTGSEWRHAAAVPPTGKGTRYNRRIAVGGHNKNLTAALKELAEQLRDSR